MMRQKMVLMRRWMKAIAAVLIVLASLRVLAYVATAGDKGYALNSAALAGVCTVLGAVIYLPLVTWLGMMIGLCISSHDRAASTAITVIAAWLLGGLALPIFFLESLGVHSGAPLWDTTLLSPATMLVEAEFGTIDKHLWGSPWLIVAVNFILYGGLARIVRRHVLAHADEYLGRAAQRTGHRGGHEGTKGERPEREFVAESTRMAG